MIKNYIKIAFRNILQHKFYSFVNIFGLTIGITSVILILLYISDELSYDKFHSEHEQIYRVVENQYYAGQPVFPVAVTPGPLAPSLKEDFHEISYTSRLLLNSNRFEYKDQMFIEEGAYVDKDFFDIFSFELIMGDQTSVFNQVNALVITETLAQKYFPDEDPVGKVIRLDGEDDMTVTGVIKDVPKNSHVQFDYLMSTDFLRKQWSGMDTAWGNNTLYTYVKVQRDTDISSLNEKIKNQIKRNKEGSVTDIYLQPLADIHLGEESFTADISGKGNMTYVKIFIIVALFILIIACINFMNLATARSARRAKEVGLRKTVGASRTQLIYQFLGESILVALIAVIISVLLVDLLLPFFNQLSEKSIEINFFNANNALNILGLMACTAILTGLLAGSYPALFLSSFHPAKILKGQNVKGGAQFRKSLVVLQFTVSIVLIIGTIIISKQLSFIQNKNLGIDNEQVIYIPGVSEKYEIFRDELLKNKRIVSIGFSNQHPAYVQNSTSGLSWEAANPEETILMHVQAIDPGYIPTMKINLETGRNFSSEIASDSNAVIVNETALKVMGYKDPIGAKINSGEQELTIVGVAKDFHFKSMHQAIEPLVLFMNQNGLSRTLIKINTSNVNEAITEIEAQWKQLNPQNTFQFRFLDEDYDNLYAAEARTARLFKYFAALAIIISCLGLFGLASFMAEQRTKEIGIRKVLGAPLANLFYLMSKDFTVLVLIAFAISIPIGWYFMSNWLETFAYKTDVTITVFLTAGVLALVITIATVSYQSISAAIQNPVDSLRSE